MNEELKKKQIEAIKKIRERFEDDAWFLLGDWIDALDEVPSEDGLPSEPIMKERARIFRAQELVGFVEDYEENE